MSVTWHGARPEPHRPARPAERLRMLARAVTLVAVTYFGIVFVVLFNLVERAVPLGIAHRIACLWGRICLWLCGLRVVSRGMPMRGGGAVVANHCGWIDIFTLLTADRVFFVSKAEVAEWPLVGWLSRQIGTVYIDRKRSNAKSHATLLEERLSRGERLCFFPEGTSTDGQRVLPFKSTLFAPFVNDGLRGLMVQPVSILYHPPRDLPRSFYGWWGDMPLGPHLKAVFSMSRGATVEVIHHPPLAASDYPDRKALAAACEAAVRQGHREALERRGDLPQG